MKAKRRHELQPNVLDAELGKVLGFLKNRGAHLAWGMLIAAIIIFVVVYVYKGRKDKSRQVQTEYMRLMAAQNTPGADAAEVIRGFEKLTAQDHNKRVAGLSCVAVGDFLAAQALFNPNTDEVERMTDNAARYYRKAFTEFPEEKLSCAKAHLGLARLLQTMGRTDEARAQYQAVQDMNLQGYSVSIFAEAELRRLDEPTTPVRMATTTVVTQPSSRPATAPAADPNVQSAGDGPADEGASPPPARKE